MANTIVSLKTPSRQRIVALRFMFTQTCEEQTVQTYSLLPSAAELQHRYARSAAICVPLLTLREATRGAMHTTVDTNRRHTYCPREHDRDIPGIGIMPQKKLPFETMFEREFCPLSAV